MKEAFSKLVPYRGPPAENWQKTWFDTKDSEKREEFESAEAKIRRVPPTKCIFRLQKVNFLGTGHGRHASVLIIFKGALG